MSWFTLPRFARIGRDWIHPESLASDEVWQAHHSGIVTALPCFARPGKDWIHPECLASDEVWQEPLELASANMGHSTGTVTETAISASIFLFT